ncbi:hypothetical protein [Nocardioides humi]|uniref:Condensation domain-containing protein n=1 Tax=Nocardioides humi TaxID=449461 RepID=A0ABN1ZT89_9ACTN|nr:hypothetical protein [Nocardioides humi]
MGAHRPMTVAEKYYTFLDRRWPTKAVVTADLDRCLDAAEVARAWQELRARRVVTRAVATEELTIADPGPDPEGAVFQAREAEPEEWPAIVAELSDAHDDLGTPVQCWYLASPATGESQLVLIGHHALIDGRIGVAELQWLVRLLDGQDVPEQQQLAVPAAPVPAHAWQRDRAAMIELLRDLKARTTAYGAPAPAAWPDPAVPRRSRMRQGALEPDAAARLVAAARGHGANAFSAVAAAALASAAGVLGDGGAEGAPTTLQFAAPADVAAPSTAPDRAREMAIAVLSRPYRVDPADVWGLASEVRSTIHAARARGEGELFFHLSRVEKVVDLDTGRDLVARALAAGPPCVAVSNLGVVDPGSDPAWVRGVRAGLAAAPNQVVFLTITGYRGRLLQLLSSDDSRLPPDRRDALVAGYRQILGELTR